MLSIEEGPPAPAPLLPSLFEVAISAFGLLVLLGFLYVGYGFVRSHRAPERAGLGPSASQSHPVAQPVRKSSLTLEQRLSQLADLHRRGVISTEEHATARRQVLSDA